MVVGSVGQPGTAAVRGGEGRGRRINLGINVGENLPVQNQIRIYRDSSENGFQAQF